MTTPYDRYSVPSPVIPDSGFIPAVPIETRKQRRAQRRERAMNRALGATSAFEAMRQGESQVPSPFGETDKNIAEKERSGLVGGIASLFDYYSDVVDPFAALRIAGETVNTPIGSIPLGPVAYASKISGIIPDLGRFAGGMLTQDMGMFSDAGKSLRESWAGDAARVEKTKEVLSNHNAGTIPFLQAWKELGDIQQDRPLMSQMASGALTDPVNVIPFGKILGVGSGMSRAGLTGVRRGVRSGLGSLGISKKGIELREKYAPFTVRRDYEGRFTSPYELSDAMPPPADPNKLDIDSLITKPEELLLTAQSPETSKRWQAIARSPYGKRLLGWATKIFSEHGVANLDDAAAKGVVLYTIQASQTNNAGRLAMKHVELEGNPVYEFLETLPPEAQELSPNLASIFQRKTGTAMSRLFPGLTRPGGQRIPLSGERLLGMFEDLFAGRTTVDAAARRAPFTGTLAGSTKAINDQMQYARKSALAAILNGDRVRRKGILNYWGVDDVVSREPVDGILRTGHINEFMKNPDLVKRIDDELGGLLPATTEYQQLLIQTGTSFPPGAGKQVTKFLREADRTRIFDETIDPVIKRQELDLVPTITRGGREVPVYPATDIATREAGYGVRVGSRTRGSQLPTLTQVPVTQGSLRFAGLTDEIFWEEVAQNMDMFEVKAGLSENMNRIANDMMKFIRRYLDTSDDIWKYAADADAIPATDFIGRNPGDYTSLMWKAIATVNEFGETTGIKDQLSFNTEIRKLFGQGKNAEEMRIRDYAADSITLKNYRGARMLESMHAGLEAPLQMIAEKYFADAVTPWTKAMQKRMSIADAKKADEAFEKELADLTDVSDDLKKQLRLAISDKGGRWEWLYKQPFRVASLMVTMGSGFDTGAPLIHGVLQLFNEPRKWGETAKDAIVAMRDPRVVNNHYKENVAIYNEMQRFNGIGFGDAEYLESLSREGIMGQALSKLEDGIGPQITKERSKSLGRTLKKITGAFGKHFDAYLLMARVETYKSLRGLALEDAAVTATKRARKAGRLAPNEQVTRASVQEEETALRALTEHVNKMFGTLDSANTGLKSSTRKVLGGWFSYAPRYRLASYALMNDLTKGGYRGTLARDRIANFLTSGLLWYSYVSYTLNQEPRLDPTRGDFLSIDVAGQQLSIAGIWKSTAKLFGYVYAKAMPESEWLGIGRGDSLDLIKPSRKDNPIVRYAMNQASGPTSSSMDFATGRNFIGEPLNDSLGNLSGFVQAYGGSLVPFWLGGFFSHAPPGSGNSLFLQTNGDPLGFGESDALSQPFLSGASEFAGLSAYPASAHERFLDTASDAVTMVIDAGDFNMPESKFGRNGKVHWNDLNKLQQQQVKNKFPAIAALELDVKQITASKNQDEISQYFFDSSHTNFKLRERVRELAELYEGKNTPIENRINGEQFRELVRQEMEKAGFSYKLLQDNLSEEAAIELEELRTQMQADPSEERNERMWDIAFNEYIARVVAPDFTTPLGEFDHHAKQQAESQFLIDWTGSADGMVGGKRDDLYSYILKRRSSWWPPILTELRLGQEAAEPYWNIPESILKTLGMETELGIYEQYRAAGILNQRMMRETYPWLRILDNATAEGRRNLRMMNPSLDQFLLKWGYVSAAMNPMHTGKTLQEIMDMSNEVTIDWNMSLVN